MLCIFGFNHQPSFPCQLIDVNDSELDNLICPNCMEKFKLDYEDFLHDEKEKWSGDFDDCHGILFEESLMKLRYHHIHTCGFKYTERQYIRVIGKIDRMIENFKLREEQRIDAKIESGDISLATLPSSTYN